MYSPSMTSMTAHIAPTNAERLREPWTRDRCRSALAPGAVLTRDLDHALDALLLVQFEQPTPPCVSSSTVSVEPRPRGLLNAGPKVPPAFVMPLKPWFTRSDRAHGRGRCAALASSNPAAGSLEAR
jgi:hypothetical protein